MHYMSHRHTTSVAQKIGTTTGRTWTEDGEGRQTGLIVGFTQALHLRTCLGRVDFLHAIGIARAGYK